MFKKARFIFAVNGALSQLGVSPQVFNPSYRNPMIETGFAEGRTPQEVATFLVHQLPLSQQPLGMEMIVKTWIAEGMVSPEFLAALQAIVTFP